MLQWVPESVWIVFKSLHKWFLDELVSSMFEWLKGDGPQKLFSCFRGKAEVRFVGGCVRNSLLGLPLKDDFDLAITCTPDLTMKFLQEAGICAVPTGIKHGTVSAIVEGVPYEITTLRKERAHDGRYAEVQFTDDWAGDAFRRDFTINALYLDEQGRVFDVVQGKEDLAQGIVRFIGDPDARIQEDYLRILRFFRIHAYYGKGELNSQAFSSCLRWMHMLGILSKERITKEFFKLLEASNPWYVVMQMIDCGMLSKILQTSVAFLPTQELEDKAQYHPGAVVRWASLTPHPCPGLCLSKKQQKSFSALRVPLESSHIRFSLYEQEKSIVLGRWWLACAETFKFSKEKALQDWYHHLEEISSFTPAFFPLNGNILLTNGVPCQRVGIVLNTVKRWWIENKENLCVGECLNYALRVDNAMSIGN
ncbi:CCA tRNA nucleotidyltransferase [Holospora undulata]|nr:CCA tRNA nucleotidyltransferase [Holospora undulata]